MPARRDDLGPFYRDVTAVDRLEPWTEASAAYRLRMLEPALPFPVAGARLVPSNNNDVWRLPSGYLRVAWRGDRGRLARQAAGLLRALHSWPVPAGLAGTGDGDVLLHGDFYLGNVLVHDGQVSALIDFEFARMGPPDLELVSVIRALDMETRLGVPRPPLLTWLAEDYPGLFAAPDLDRRLWAYAIAYTIRHIVFWPPDRPETEGLDPAHPLPALRRLVDAPLPR